MNGVNLIDFTMPSAVPTPAGGKARTTTVGGMKLIFPKRIPQEAKTGEQAGTEAKTSWWKILLILLGVVVLLKMIKKR